ncbi:MAG: flagellin [Phycisphaerae bacterium]|nr:flagellin [Phycisphaerae bacterium]
MRIGETAMIATRMYNANLNAASRIMNSLATGFRINRAADDPAGLISSLNLSSSLQRLDAESRSLSRTDLTLSAADGAMTEVSDLLNDAEGLAVASASTGGASPEEREAMQLEFDSIMQSVDRLASSSGFNGRRLFDGRMTLGVGEDSITLSKLSTHDLGLSGASLAGGDPQATIDAIRAARAHMTAARAEVGAFQKDAIAPRVRAMAIASENTASAVSIIRDTDYAAAFSAYARQGALISASGASLNATNASANGVLKILGG